MKSKFVILLVALALVSLRILNVDNEDSIGIGECNSGDCVARDVSEEPDTPPTNSSAASNKLSRSRSSNQTVQNFTYDDYGSDDGYYLEYYEVRPKPHNGSKSSNHSQAQNKSVAAVPTLQSHPSNGDKEEEEELDPLKVKYDRIRQLTNETYLRKVRIAIAQSGKGKTASVVLTQVLRQLERNETPALLLKRRIPDSASLAEIESNANTITDKRGFDIRSEGLSKVLHVNGTVSTVRCKSPQWYLRQSVMKRMNMGHQTDHNDWPYARKRNITRKNVGDSCFTSYRFCSRAGVPNSTRCGQCTCERSRQGKTCSSFRPRPQQSWFDGIYDKEINTWGGTPLKDDAGRYHLLASAFINGSVDNWFESSVIVHAISTTGLRTGPYSITGVVLKGSGDNNTFDATAVHNPHVSRLPDGRWALYYIGLNCMKPFDDVKRCEKHQSIGIAVAERPEGPWERHSKEPILDPTPCGPEWGVAANPSVIVKRNGNVVLFYRGAKDDSVFVAIADTWNSTYHRKLDGLSVVRIGQRKLEDMYVWKTRFGCSMISHVQAFKGKGRSLLLSGDRAVQFSAALREAGAFWISILHHSRFCSRMSIDGWTEGDEEPYGECVDVKYDKIEELPEDARAQANETSKLVQRCFSRRERPQLLLEDGAPTMLCTAVEERRVLSLVRGVPRYARKQFTLCSELG